ncbi:hypothetical protein [Amycolatopsis sp.]|uniref:hypothetical protein n=1 Tax=Amycolatopsis sp. TaxID=37632 RepID=UPI002B7709F0|nr:hypothetical protein [Amycolatopsis sp.]HVV14650.1 hypothetical protein [Amycolatopsis sp.]
MRNVSTRTQRAVARFNSGVMALRSSRLAGRFVRKHLIVVTYTGRRSGRTFQIPVGYRRRGDTVTIGVRMPDVKSWWRNFTGDGGPLTLDLDGAPSEGHAVARRDARGVTVTVRLTA